MGEEPPPPFGGLPLGRGRVGRRWLFIPLLFKEGCPAGAGWFFRVPPKPPLNLHQHPLRLLKNQPVFKPQNLDAELFQKQISLTVVRLCFSTVMHCTIQLDSQSL